MSLTNDYYNNDSLRIFAEKVALKKFRENIKEIDMYQNSNPYNLIKSAVDDHYYIEAFAVADQYIQYILWNGFIDHTSGLVRNAKKSWQRFLDRVKKAYAVEYKDFNAEILTFQELRVEVVHYALIKNSFSKVYNEKFPSISLLDYLESIVKKAEDVFIKQMVKLTAEITTTRLSEILSEVAKKEYNNISQGEFLIIGKMLYIYMPIRDAIYTRRYFSEFLSKNNMDDQEKLLELWGDEVQVLFTHDMAKYS